MNPSPLPPLALLPDHADVFGWAAHELIRAYQAQLPDLSNLTLVLPSVSAAGQLRRQLLRAAGRPLLGPSITTLHDFARRGATSLPFSALDCRLLLTELLAHRPSAFGAQNHWLLADELFRIFEELSADTPELAQDQARFLARVRQGYGTAAATPLSEEAAGIHLLWQAYLQDTGDRSPAVSYLRHLHAALVGLQPAERVVLIGFDQLRRGEQAVLKPFLARGQLFIWLHGALDGRGKAALQQLVRALGEPLQVNMDVPKRGQSLQLAFDDQPLALNERRQRSVGHSRIRLAAARQTEHEARIVDVAVREAWLSGHRDIAVVTQDRRLARRLRALLERAGISLRDEVGWALSTSAAAASLGHWLDCCEQNFPFRSLLALLKCAFFRTSLPQDLQQLESLIYRNQVASGLPRFMAMNGAPSALLTPLQQAARLLAIPSSATQRPGSEWNAALLQSLKELPLWTQWQQDPAGQQLIRVLEELRVALLKPRLSCTWMEYRSLLESLLEQATFLPDSQDDAVRLLTLEQARGLRCDLLILAGASESQFPGKVPADGLFNHAVRAELGLSHWTCHLDVQLSRFRCLLHAAPDILISYAPEQNQEHGQPCRWVQWLETLGLVVPDTALALRAQDPQSEITAEETLAPSTAGMPQPLSAPELLPAVLSASAHQTLMDCPYRFFAQRCLRLYSAEEPDRPVEAKDFGMRVHRILQAFHEKLPGLPAPFDRVVSMNNRHEAEHKLHEIAAAVFAQDLRTRALARLWAARFGRMIPEIVLWMMERQADWPVVEVEQTLKRTLMPQLQIEGKLDRLETNTQGDQCIVDYKTGASPKNSDLQTGETVQAVHYAMLAPSCVRVEYFSLNPDQKAPKALEGEILEEVRDSTEQRLVRIYRMLHAGAPMPANGDRRSCETCDHSGLCRKGGWHE